MKKIVIAALLSAQLAAPAAAADLIDSHSEGTRTGSFAGARLRLLPFLFINGRAFQTFRVTEENRRYDNTFGFAFDVEVGYEFQKTGRTEATTPVTDSTPVTESTAANEKPGSAQP